MSEPARRVLLALDRFCVRLQLGLAFQFDDLSRARPQRRIMRYGILIGQFIQHGQALILRSGRKLRRMVLLNGLAGKPQDDL